MPQQFTDEQFHQVKAIASELNDVLESTDNSGIMLSALSISIASVIFAMGHDVDEIMAIMHKFVEFNHDQIKEKYRS